MESSGHIEQEGHLNQLIMLYTTYTWTERYLIKAAHLSGTYLDRTIGVSSVRNRYTSFSSCELQMFLDQKSGRLNPQSSCEGWRHKYGHIA